MDGDQFKTPLNKTRYDSLLRSTATKRDSLAAELERDPQLSVAKRQQRTQVFTSSMAHANLERQLLAAQTTKMELETKLREKDLLIERLERDRRWFADREKQEREEKEKERAEHDEEKRKTDSDLRNLRTSLTSLREELADLQDAHSSLSRSTAQTIASQKSQITTLTHRDELLSHELEQAKMVADQRSRTIEELQEQYEQLSSNQDALMRRAQEEENMVVVREELHRQAEYLRTLESTNAKLTAELTVLRDRHTSVEVLREEKRGLERKVKLMDELREKVVRLEAEVEAGRREREEWASKAADSSAPSKIPVSVTQNLSDLRLVHARLLEEHGATTALLRRREANILDYERREAEAQQNVQSLSQHVRSLQEQLNRKDTTVMLAEREVGFLQALVASFNAEEASLENVQFDEMKNQRIQQLEALLQEYKATNLQLAKEIDALGGSSSSLGQGQSREALSSEVEKERLEKAALQKVLEEAESETKLHLEKIEELEQTLFELGGEMAGGRHVPPGVRVLSMKDNPEQQWFDLRQAAMDRLKGENEALIKRLKELEESGFIGGGSVSNQQPGEELVPRESWELVTREKNELEETVKQKEKRLLRLQQIFASKSAEFREAIASILGVKLAFYPNGQIRVTSMYDLCASFVFKPASQTEDNMKMQLIAQGEGGPEDLPNMMHYWIENERCIPGFLASVTLECYEKSKREGGGVS
ncbi:spindle assembly checkpoint component Mad1 [Crucibulum laeve]|uniref:Spindle assembly checkpoint component MAD1 n=1 Tax=Crucibulum laeve TaxID=68775 RepID=A0A5C3LT59_9AGAR|nr:spindle assembly checkpoint component Mad1 [Crucibulum laeve]